MPSALRAAGFSWEAAACVSGDPRWSSMADEHADDDRQQGHQDPGGPCMSDSAGGIRLRQAQRQDSLVQRGGVARGSFEALRGRRMWFVDTHWGSHSVVAVQIVRSP